MILQKSYRAISNYIEQFVGLPIHKARLSFIIVLTVLNNNKKCLK